MPGCIDIPGCIAISSWIDGAFRAVYIGHGEKRELAMVQQKELLQLEPRVSWLDDVEKSAQEKVTAPIILPHPPNLFLWILVFRVYHRDSSHEQEQLHPIQVFK